MSQYQLVDTDPKRWPEALGRIMRSFLAGATGWYDSAVWGVYGTLSL